MLGEKHPSPILTALPKSPLPSGNSVRLCTPRPLSPSCGHSPGPIQLLMDRGYRAGQLCELPVFLNIRKPLAHIALTPGIRCSSESLSLSKPQGGRWFTARAPLLGKPALLLGSLSLDVGVSMLALSGMSGWALHLHSGHLLSGGGNETEGAASLAHAAGCLWHPQLSSSPSPKFPFRCQGSMAGRFDHLRLEKGFITISHHE